MKLSTRLTIAMVALVLLTATAVSLLTYRNVVALALPSALERSDTQARVIATVLEASVQGARADVIGFRASNALAEVLALRSADAATGASDAEWRRRLAVRFAADLSAKADYSQIRVIGLADGGREIVRVDRSGPGGAIRVVPDDELQRSGEWDPFREVVNLPAGKVHVSPVHLNKELGFIEAPHVPTLRIATPIHWPDGTAFGVLVINVDLRPAFARVRSNMRGNAHVYVVNESWDYLVHPDPNREFGFELGKPYRLNEDFPAFPGLTTTAGSAPQVIADRAGASFGVGWKTVSLAGGPQVTVVEAIPYARLLAGVTAIRNASLAGGLMAVLCALGLAVALARSLTRPLVQMTRAVEGFGRDEVVAVPRAGSGEIRVLTDAFMRMAGESRRKTAALKQEIEERSRVFDTSPDLILVTNRRGVFTRVNPASETILGYRPEEMIGRSAAEFIFPDDLDRTREEMRSARRGRIVRSFEARYFRKDGRIVLLSWSGVWSDPTQQYFFVGRDMTEQRSAEEKLRESNEMARAIVANSLDAIVQVDQNGRVIEWNPQAEAIFGWSRAEAVGQPLTSLYIPEGSRPRYLDMNEQLRKTGEIRGERFEFEAVRKDGQKVKTEISMTGMPRHEGNVFNLFLRDMTQKIAAEEQLRHAHKLEAVGQLTGGIAHDFNNMLTVITGTIDILAEAVADKPELANIAKLISEAADRGAELTSHLLAFARKQPLQPRKIDVNELISETERMLRPSLGEHIEIRVKFERNAWPAVVDPTQLTSALLNLAVNARDAMPGGGHLMFESGNVVLDESYVQTVEDVPPGHYVMIAVTDTGCGIPEEIRDKIFEPFYSTKDVGKGTGLGLSMVYGFVKQSGGYIRVYSEVGFGTTFKVYLPRAQENSDEAGGPAAEAVLQGGNETILAVEDDALVRTYVTAQLQSLGYKTLSAENAKEALALIDGGAEFDLLFTDIIMPGGINGRELADEAGRRKPSLKVLFTSGYTEDAIVHHGRLDPGVLLLPKPYRKADLARMLRQALAGAPHSTAPQPARANSRAS
jgi:PAS domain S-box-containing protein